MKGLNWFKPIGMNVIDMFAFNKQLTVAFVAVEKL